MAKGLFPLGRHPYQALLDELRRAEVTIEHLHASDSSALHPMPPGARLGRVRRILETAQKRIIIRVLCEHLRAKEESDKQDRARACGQPLSHESVSPKKGSSRKPLCMVTPRKTGVNHRKKNPQRFAVRKMG